MESEKMNSKANAKDAAEWMLQMLDKRGSLPQDEAASSIKKNFGDEFVYENDSGNPAISKAVLTEFRKLTEGSVVWSRRSGESCEKGRSMSGEASTETGVVHGVT